MSLPTDLDALCKVSQSWHSIASPKLYSNITVDLSNKDEVELLVACIGGGDEWHLNYPTSLTLNDARRPVEPTEMALCTLAEQGTVHPKRETDMGALMINSMFSKNTLQSFL